MVTRSLERDAGREVVTPHRGRRRSRVALTIVAAVAVLLVVCGLVGAGWHYSDQLLVYPPPDEGWDVDQQVDVAEAQGVAAEPWTIDGPLGSYDGVFVPGSADTWVLVVHGRGAPLADAATTVPVLADADLPVVLTSFRNDGFAPDDPDGLGTLDDVTLLRPSGVGHVAWSDAHPAAYAAALRRFLTAAIGAS